ncbi:type I restriction-modification system subunit M [Bartonella sp. B10834G6]|uniref:type I restriction-modification system subunit M n=1 Tax=Bartonella apis TaxID=1686310 RepID=UPI0018DB8A34|nr:type I restriction-modification system subunit M [Bartonella apis]MBH9983069.1 type I restriction-modification system subunit M [Bartonella apis]
MAVRKSEIYSQIWAACDKLRGGVEPARYKDYILTLLFIKYVSDRFKSSDNWDIEIPEGGSFDDIVKLKYAKNIGEGINIVISKLAEVNDLKGVIDIADFNSEELGTDKVAVDKLSGLVEIFQKPELDFTKNRAGGDDILGDAYEFLMRKFAQDSGKSKGQFYTPGEVSRIMSKVIGLDKATDPSMTVYDPACGSGSLLIRAADSARVEITIYGQEIDPSTAGLARMNLVLHNKGYGEIRRGSTIASPAFFDENNPVLLRRFDYIVVNPPFSDKSWMDGIGIPDIYGRYSDAEFGVPPEKNGDFAWLLHVIKSLKSNGKAAIILPHGVLFRGNAEAAIRKKIIDQGFIKGIIGLPPNLFFGTGIPACIIIIDKEDAAQRKGLFMIDASKGFVKDGNKNRLREQDIHKIVTTFINADTSNPKYARFVPNDEIKNINDYNLNIPRYIDNSEPEDLQDINAHLNGGIPAADVNSMQAYWDVYPSLKGILFQPLREGYYRPVVDKEKIVSTITSQAEYIEHANMVDAAYSSWKEAITPLLSELSQETHPNLVIAEISESLLKAFSNVPLLDKYDVYQVLMEYWDETMQDDVYAIYFGGYEAGREIAYEYVTKKKKEHGVTVEVQTNKTKGFEGRLIPKDIVAKYFFSDTVNAINNLRSQLEDVTAAMEEMAEQYSGEDGFFSTLDDLKKGTIEARIKEIKKDSDAKDELKALQKYIKLLKVESNYKKALRLAEVDLDTRVEKRYATLTIAEIKHLLLEEKWFATIYAGIDAIHTAVSQQLSSRATELVERYEFTLKECEDEVNVYEAKVKSHLERMGFAW